RRLPVAAPRVVDVREGVARALVDLDVHALARFLQGVLEPPNLIRRGALVFASEVAEDRSLDGGDGRGVGGRRAVVGHDKGPSPDQVRGFEDALKKAGK